MMGRLLSLLGVSARLGLAGGTLYGSHQLGVWGNGKQGEKVRNIIVLFDWFITKLLYFSQVYNQLKTAQLKDLVPAEMVEYIPDLPDTGVADQVSGVCETVGDVTQNLGSYYNKGVIATVQAVSDLPTTVKNYSNQAVEWVQENAK